MRCVEMRVPEYVLNNRIKTSQQTYTLFGISLEWPPKKSKHLDSLGRSKTFLLRNYSNGIQEVNHYVKLSNPPSLLRQCWNSCIVVRCLFAYLDCVFTAHGARRAPLMGWWEIIKQRGENGLNEAASRMQRETHTGQWESLIWWHFFRSDPA